MTRFNYKVVASLWGTGGLIANSKFTSVTIHHSAVKSSVNNYSSERRAKTYAQYHRKKGNKGIAYHIFIGRDNTNDIYITNFLTGHTWHNSNFEGNKQALAILVDGNFEVEKPSEMQLKKLRQLLDDLSSNWFTNNKWYSFETRINPKSHLKRKYSGITVFNCHWHNEVAQKGNATACCGNNLETYIKDYRYKKGQVTWGVDKPKPPTNLKPCQKELDKIQDLELEIKELELEIENLKGLNLNLENETKELTTQLKESNEIIKTQDGIINTLRKHQRHCDKFKSSLFYKLYNFFNNK